jgi:hypothetical protein
VSAGYARASRRSPRCAAGPSGSTVTPRGRLAPLTDPNSEWRRRARVRRLQIRAVPPQQPAGVAFVARRRVLRLSRWVGSATGTTRRTAARGSRIAFARRANATDPACWIPRRRANPANFWVASQRVRYLARTGGEGCDAAALCVQGETLAVWDARGFAYHEAGDYVPRRQCVSGGAARDVHAKERCDWEDISLLIDTELLPTVPCAAVRRTRRDWRSSGACGGSRGRCSRRRRTMRAPSTTRA